MRIVVACALASLAVGCAHQVEGTDDDSGTGAGVTTGGPGATTTTTSGGGDLPREEVQGSLGAWSGEYDVGPQSSAFALFVDGGFGCEVSRMGPCVVSRCPVEMVTTLSAGSISVTGGLQSPVELTLGADGEYAGNHDPGALLFDGGEVLTFVARGGDVPAFTSALEAPATGILTSPTGETMTVDTSADFAVAWNGGSATTVVTLWGIGSGSLARSVSCMYEADTHSAVVPAEAIAELAGASSGFVHVITMSYEYVDAGSGWLIGVHLSSAMKQPSGEEGWFATKFE